MSPALTLKNRRGSSCRGASRVARTVWDGVGAVWTGVNLPGGRSSTCVEQSRGVGMASLRVGGLLRGLGERAGIPLYAYISPRVYRHP